MSGEDLSDDDRKAIKRQIDLFKKLKKTVEASGGSLPSKLQGAGKKLETAPKAKTRDAAVSVTVILQHELTHFMADVDEVKKQLGRKGATIQKGTIIIDKAATDTKCAKTEEIKLRKGGSLAVKKGKTPQDALKTIKDISTTENGLRQELGLVRRDRY